MHEPSRYLSRHSLYVLLPVSSPTWALQARERERETERGHDVTPKPSRKKERDREMLYKMGPSANLLRFIKSLCIRRMSSQLVYADVFLTRHAFLD